MDTIHEGVKRESLFLSGCRNKERSKKLKVSVDYKTPSNSTLSSVKLHIVNHLSWENVLKEETVTDFHSITILD